MIHRHLKVEKLERRLLLASDFGDAPYPYATLQADGGAEHEAVGPQLGATRDTESDGVPDANGNGDGSDEDGVVFGVVRVGQIDAQAIVTVQNAPSGARLDAWVDFNRDGNWGGANERIAASLEVVEGLNVLSFDVPADIVSGATFARFRLSTGGGLGPRGSAPDGEVEDYFLLIDSPAPAMGVLPTANLGASWPDTSFDTRNLSAADMDGDGDNDLLLASTNSLTWLENDAQGNLTEHEIAALTSDSFAKAADVDGDGDMDVVAVWSSTLAWFENDGAQVFIQHNIPAEGFPESIDLADIDGDGDLDVVAASNSVEWYENEGGQIFTSHTLSSSRAFYVKAIDMDRDGDVDFVTGSNTSYGQQIAWYENLGTQFFPRRSITSDGSRHTAVAPIDLDNDGDIDIAFAADFGGPYDAVRWLDNDGAGNFNLRTAASGITGPQSLFPADIDGDGDVDILASLELDDTVIVLLNDGAEKFQAYSLVTSSDSTATSSTGQVLATDLDGDGDLDIALAKSTAKEVVWLESYPRGIVIKPTQKTLLEDGGESSSFLFARSNNLDQLETASFSVRGTATFGSDYAVSGAASFDATSGSVTFPVGVSSVELVITPNSDNDFELDETITLVLDASEEYAYPGRILEPISSSITILHDEPADFGDAPLTFQTNLVTGGAAHGTTGPTLGALRDADSDGQPSPNADGDGADEDGVTFITARVGQQDAVVLVNVRNAPAGARLDAWFDFDGDGNWSAAGEQVVANLAVVEGDNAVAIDIPASAKSGLTYARFRLSSVGSLGPVGYAADGEVEDYLFQLDSPLGGGSFIEHDPIDSAVTNPRSIALLDVDEDGDLDVLASSSGNSLYWYENSGQATFDKHLIFTTTTTLRAFVAVDFDRDGDLDFWLGTGSSNEEFIYLENDGNFNFSQTTVNTFLYGVQVISIADIDRDGDYDVAAVGNGGSVYSGVVWLENRGALPYWEHMVVSGIDNMSTYSLALGDFTEDGAIDVIAQAPVQSPGFDRFFLYENNGVGVFEAKEIGIFPIAVRLIAADIDDDDDLDIVLSRPGVYLWHNQGDAVFDLEYLYSTGGSGETGFPADLDGDGFFDLLSTTLSTNSIYWAKNPGTQDGLFIPAAVTTSVPRAFSVVAGDLDGDGDLDVVAGADGINGQIRWFENIPQNSGDFNSDGDVDGSDFLTWQRNFGATGATRNQGDADLDGDVDANDLQAWRATYGNVEPLPGGELLTDEQSTPIQGEPTTAAVDFFLTDLAISTLATRDQALANWANPAEEVVPSRMPAERRTTWRVASTDASVQRVDRSTEYGADQSEWALEEAFVEEVFAISFGD